LCVLYSTNLLHGKKVIDQTMLTRHLLAQAVAQQFFGCFISMNCWLLHVFICWLLYCAADELSIVHCAVIV